MAHCVSSTSTSSSNSADRGRAKVGTATDIVEISEANKAEHKPLKTSSEQWQPGFWIQFPWLGLGSLAIVVLLMILTIVVLTTSDGRPVASWPSLIPPSVLIQGLNHLSSVFIAIAVIQGVTISWWRKAIHGSTITELHNIWSFGMRSFHITWNVRRFNIAALTALVTKLTIVDGLLYQKATVTITSTMAEPYFRNITTFPTNEMPATAFWDTTATQMGVTSAGFGKDYKKWLSSWEGLVTPVDGFDECKGLCTFNMLAPGYVASCDKAEVEQVDILQDLAVRWEQGQNQTVIHTQTTIFDVSFNMSLPDSRIDYSWIGLNVTTYETVDWTSDMTNSTCPAKLHKYQCRLRLAMLNYPVVLQFVNVSTTAGNDKNFRVDLYLAKLDMDTGTVRYGEYTATTGQISGVEFKEYINQPETRAPLQSSYNGGIRRALNDRYSSKGWINASLHPVGDGYWWEMTGFSEHTLASQLFNWSHEVSSGPNSLCHQPYDDPMTVIMSGLNALTFITANDIYNRASYRAWRNASSSNSDEAFRNSTRHFVQAEEWRRELHYRTNWAFMFGGLATTTVCCLLTLPAFWGFWQLGRRVTLNPIEIAAAFRAPLLDSVNARSGCVEDVVRVSGSRVVKYEDIGAREGVRRLRFVAA